MKHFINNIYSAYCFDFSRMQWPFMNLDHSVLHKLIHEQLDKGRMCHPLIIYIAVLCQQLGKNQCNKFNL